MRKNLFIYLLLITNKIFCQQIVTQSIEVAVERIEINLQDVDFATIETSKNDQLEVLINNKEGIKVVDQLYCDTEQCKLNIISKPKIEHPLTNKINQFTQQPPSHVSVNIKIPKNKKVVVLGDIVDLNSEGYNGFLKVFIEKGNIRLGEVLGITEINLFSGNVYATVMDHSLDISTRKGMVTWGESKLKRTMIRRVNKEKSLKIRAINANIKLQPTTQ